MSSLSKVGSTAFSATSRQRGRQVHVRRGGKIREGVGWRKGGEGERKKTEGEGERAGRARLAGQA